jgi:hypothetical protein
MCNTSLNIRKYLAMVSSPNKPTQVNQDLVDTLPKLTTPKKDSLFYKTERCHDSKHGILFINYQNREIGAMTPYLSPAE